MEYLKKEEESQFDYILRLLKGQADGIYEITDVELFKFAFGMDLSKDEARKRGYGLKALLPYIDIEKIKNITGDEVINELTLQKFELQKERVKLSTDKLELNRWIRENAREEMFIEQIISAIKSNSTEPKPIRQITINRGKRRGILCMADAHFGKEYTIFGLRDEIINQYSPEIFYERMESLFAETLERIRIENLTEIDVFSLGDTLDGFIRNSQLWTLRYGVVDSSIIYGKYIAKWLKNLSEKVYVRYHQTAGNHCELRLLDGKKGEHSNENIEKIVSTIIEIRNEDNPNFEIIQNKTGLIFTNVCGFNLLGIHGEVKDLAKALKDFSDVYDVKIDYVIAGHKHHGTFENCGVRKGTIGIGSIVGTDDFSIKLLKQADASANFIMFEEGKGRVVDYSLILN